MVKIVEKDRIRNLYPPQDPEDKTELNADNVMLIFDNLVDGKYRFKLCCMTYQEILDLPDKEPGEVYFATDIKQFVGWTGTNLVILG